MNPTENIKHLIETLNMKADAELGKRTIRDAIEALPKEKALEPAYPNAGIWRIIMKSKITKLAAAAIIIIAVVVGIYHYSGSIDGTSAAYATVLENIRKAHSVAYKQRIIDVEDKISSNMVNSAGILRHDGGNGEIQIIDGHTGDLTGLTLYTKEKKAILARYIRPKYKFDWLTWITERFGQNSEYKGRRIFQGRVADLYEVNQPLEKRSVWVDPETQLPLYMEERHIPDSKIICPGVFLRVTDFGGTGDLKMVFPGNVERTFITSDFQWNVDVNDSLFSITPPPDYNVIETNLIVSEPNGTEIVDLLKFDIELYGPQFPANIDILADPNVNRLMLIKKFHKGGVPEEELNHAAEFFNILSRAISFVEYTKAESNWFYDSNASVGDANAPVCWWKLKNGQGYRVIYGDLSIRDVNDMPQ